MQTKVGYLIAVAVLGVLAYFVVQGDQKGFMERPRKRQLQVVLANGEENINVYLSDVIKEIIKDKYVLRIKSVFFGEDLMKLAATDDVDIFIVIVNNIRFRPVYPPQERIEKSLQLIAHIKKTSGKPVIVLSGWLNNPSLTEENVKKTGADYYFALPLKEKDFKAAVDNCI